MLWMLSSLLALVATRPCIAQDAAVNLRREAAANHENSLGTVTPTTEMWFYEQERKRHDDPKLAVRRRAEQRGQERHERLASLQWYGLSNSRPTVSPTPWYGGYSTYWGSNTYDPLRWRPVQPSFVIARPAGRAD
jgi:hypothetical protein